MNRPPACEGRATSAGRRASLLPLAAQLALGPFTSNGQTYAAGTVVFPADAATTAALDAAGQANGVFFRPVTAASLPALDPIDRVPRLPSSPAP